MRRAPAPTVADAVDELTATFDMGVVSMPSPAPVEHPDSACPPERTVNGTAFVLANSTAADTSALDTQRATAEGNTESNLGS